MDPMFDDHDEDFDFIHNLLNDSDDSEHQQGGSRPGRSKNINRNRVAGAEQLYDK